MLGLLLGVRGRTTWERVRDRRRLLISVETVTEVMTVASRMLDRLPNALQRAEALIEQLEVPPVDRYQERLEAAANALRDGPPSRNGSEKDAHILALAWSSGADIWSHERDFAGTGWPSWSSANLAAALSEESAAPTTQR
jgi:predicted nucleic acid-binding protein